ncbi:serine hydrolase domain-containing protein [Nocardia cyriacigeorgica]|uniref:serine hydrolase domain-containing protein n=1 Tax=Nocardia cyriacigeorgica TaxID=135487 RepID=UPI002454E656|nr:serine hydrolase domain-containing protein [Nocardia cyriacigeorgica]
MRMRVLALAVCTAAVVLSACTTSSVESTSVAEVGEARVDTVRGDLEAMVRAGAVGAMATLTEGDSTTVVTAGLADIGAGEPIPADPPQHVRVGSVTKTFTAAIVLQLAAEGRIDLDRSIDTYLPGLLTGDGVDGRAITVRQILSHRSGLPEPVVAPEMNEHRAAVDGITTTPVEVIGLALRQPARFAPGARFEYANINYIVIGMLIEAVTGNRYTDELRDRILTPLGLADTYLPATGETGLREPHPTGYTTVDGAALDETSMEPSVPWTSGALVSTGADLNRFFTALLAGEVLPPTQLRQMLDGIDMGNGDGISYGLGIGYFELPCGARYVGHTGDVRGFSTISGATAAGRSVTYSYTGTPAPVDIGAVLTHALCG